MLKDKLIDRALGSAGLPVTVDRSRCMRMRFDRNECPVCTSNCHAGAITIDDEIVIDTNKCTQCMVCVSECPADCFNAKDGDFFGILVRLRNLKESVPCPVLGCKAVSGTNAHEKTACLGSLSDEHFIALNRFMDRPVKLNLTECKRCKNSFIIDTLKERIAGIRETTAIDVSERVILIENMADLRFEAASYDRRGFFSAVKNMAFLGASGFLGKEESDVVQSYSLKMAPLKRDILNTTLRKMDKDIAARILREYAFSIRADVSCDNCFSCVGMCPTGALKCRREDSEAGLLFNSSLCNGCALCRDFCPNRSIALSQGNSGEDYFEHIICNKDSGSAEFPECGSREDAVDEVCCYG
ncbi:MAG: 4Fe-4S binding protein [Thermodesulfovibrionales bacterium]